MAKIPIEKAADQTFNSASINAQSGVAVNEACSQRVWKTSIAKNASKVLIGLSAHPIFLLLQTSTSTQAIYGCYGSNVSLLCGTAQTKVTVTANSGEITITNGQSYTIRCAAITTGDISE